MEGSSDSKKTRIMQVRYTYKPRVNPPVSEEEATPHLGGDLARRALRAMRTKSALVISPRNQNRDKLPSVSEQSEDSESLKLCQIVTTDKRSITADQLETNYKINHAKLKKKVDGELHTVVRSISNKEGEKKEAKYDSALNSIKKLCVSKVTPFSLPDDFYPASKVRVISNEDQLTATFEKQDCVDNTLKPLKCSVCGSNVRMINKFRSDGLWKLECRNVACLKTIDWVPYDTDYAKQLDKLYDDYLNERYYSRNKKEGICDVHDSNNMSFEVSSDEEVDERGNIYILCPGQKEKAILF